MKKARQPPAKVLSPARRYCPECEPNTDPIAEVLEVRWCVKHEPSMRGADDSEVTLPPLSSAVATAGGENNRRFCNLIHRGSGRRAKDG